MMKLFKFTLFILTLCAGFISAHAQQSNKYPVKPIRLVVPFPAGGPTDQFARQYAQALSTQLGKPIVVDNKSGASGAIGSLEVKNSAPDGYTLLFGTASTHVLYNLINTKPQYDSIKDFTQIAVVGDAPIVFAVSPATKGGFKELVEYARINPGKLQYGSAGEGTYLHIVGERLKYELGGLDIQHIPFRGSAQSIPALMGNQVNMTVDTLGSLINQHRAGKLKIVAIATSKRSPLIPDVPTVNEVTGLKDFQAALWNIVSAPQGLSPDITNTLILATTKALKNPELLDKLNSISIQPISNITGVAATSFIAKELVSLRPVVQSAGLKKE
ncbi:Bug family tripartite tricarboxylate transporter substrate binding protein [Polynucleobacter hallstattensis]|uniref:Bug family tripartite tricarboxylate transporter substrate binding protein n=1 Tax=Polynucleobacter hallstattensis TaxID=1855586 RepID=UPI001C0E7F88|nr:tripartite tricarboxylate transporter substrate binding protein [Polynucleobacter hallstattensis]MBU3560059.1 tripartite tricarboxylate transporter substrate binding protein [Polynucleobacter hallstattensis]